ncbi:MAG: sugar ABC transporter permease, partial [Elusimicrobiota bacterium]|nr:sugar ABC transporter permease [Elusimicrobiota bacterium]
SFQVFTQIYVMTGGGPGYSSTTVIPLIYFRAFRDYEFGIASAQALVLFVVIVFVSVLEFKYIRRRGEYI